MLTKRVYEFLKNAEVYYLATVEGDQPRVRPFGTINEFEDKLYIQTGKIKPTSHQIAVNPKAELGDKYSNRTFYAQNISHMGLVSNSEVRTFVNQLIDGNTSTSSYTKISANQN